MPGEQPFDRQFGDLAVTQLIVMAGLSGAGKSTIGEIVGARLGATVVSVDPIESAILRAGIDADQPTGLAAYLVAACNQPNVARQREVQLWLPPSSGNQGGTLLQSTTSNAEGYFEFRGLNPCIVYELKIIQGSVVTVASGILAGADTVQTGPTAGVVQKYIISDATGAVCNVLPDPP